MQVHPLNACAGSIYKNSLRLNAHYTAAVEVNTVNGAFLNTDNHQLEHLIICTEYYFKNMNIAQDAVSQSPR